jgi:hypothetical protein
MTTAAPSLRPATAASATLRARTLHPLTLAGLLLAALTGLFVLFAFYSRKGAYGSDWQTFYTAAQHLRHGQPVYVVVDGFFNPPPVLLLLLPFTVVSYQTSRVIWATLSAIMLLVSALLTANACGYRPSARERALTFLWIAFYVPTILLVPLTGNFSALLLLAYTAAFWSFTRGHDRLGGMALALTLVKPQLAFLGLPLLLFMRRGQATAAYLLTVLALALAALPVVGLANYRDFVQVERAVSAWSSTNDALQLDVPGVHGLLLQRWPHQLGAEVVSAALSLCILAALAWYWRTGWRPGGLPFAAGWSLLLLCTLLVSTFAHSYDQVLLIVPAIVLWVYRQRLPSLRLPITLVLVALYAGPPLVLAFHQHFMVPFMLAALALLLWVARRPLAPDLPHDLHPI